MAEPRWNKTENTILAHCQHCNGAITSFDTRGPSNTNLGFTITNIQHTFRGQPYGRIINRFYRCSNCNNGAVARTHDNGNDLGAVLENFIPMSPVRATIPPSVPQDLLSEFREAETVAGIGAYRAASALLRSVLEKSLKKNGYEEIEFVDAKGSKRKSSSLLHRIEAAADDGVITQARKQRVHENVRVLGNDVLHDDWREVTESEFADSHRYTQRILEDLYDDRNTVETILANKGRLQS